MPATAGSGRRSTCMPVSGGEEAATVNDATRLKLSSFGPDARAKRAGPTGGVSGCSAATAMRAVTRHLGLGCTESSEPRAGFCALIDEPSTRASFDACTAGAAPASRSRLLNRASSCLSALPRAIASSDRGACDHRSPWSCSSSACSAGEPPITGRTR